MLEAYLSRPDMVQYYECGDFPFNFAFLGFGKEVTADEVMTDCSGPCLEFLPKSIIKQIFGVQCGK